jgi:hypothetical protein
VRPMNYDTAMGVFGRLADEESLGTRVQHDCRDGWCGTSYSLVAVVLDTVGEGPTPVAVAWKSPNERSVLVTNGTAIEVTNDLLVVKDEKYDGVEIPIEEIVAIAI